MLLMIAMMVWMTSITVTHMPIRCTSTAWFNAFLVTIRVQPAYLVVHCKCPPLKVGPAMPASLSILQGDVSVRLSAYCTDNKGRQCTKMSVDDAYAADDYEDNEGEQHIIVYSHKCKPVGQ